MQSIKIMSHSMSFARVLLLTSIGWSKAHLYLYIVHKNRSKNKCQLSHCAHCFQLTFTTWYVDPNALEFVIVPAHGGCYVYFFTCHTVVSITAIGSRVVDSVSSMYVCSISYNRWFIFTGYLCKKMFIYHVHSLNMYRHIQVVTGAPLLVYSETARNIQCAHPFYEKNSGAWYLFSALSVI